MALLYTLFSLSSYAANLEPTRLIYKLSTLTTWTVEIEERVDLVTKSKIQTVRFVLDDPRFSDAPVIISSQEAPLASLILPNPDVISGPDLDVLEFDNVETHHENLVQDGYFMARLVFQAFRDRKHNYAPETQVFSVMQIISKRWRQHSFALPELKRNSNYPFRDLKITPVINDEQRYVVSITDSQSNGKFIRTTFKTRDQGQPPEKLESTRGERFNKIQTQNLGQSTNIVKGLDNVVVQPAEVKLITVTPSVRENPILNPLMNRTVFKSPNGKFEVRMHKFTGDIEIFNALTGKKLRSLPTSEGFATIEFKYDDLLYIKYAETDYIVAARLSDNEVVSIDSIADSNFCADLLTRGKH